MNAAVTATFLFTDLVGSTALSQRLGHEQATDLRQVHFGLLRTAAGSRPGGRTRLDDSTLWPAIVRGVEAELGRAIFLQQ